MPNLQDSLQHLHGAQIFTNLDIIRAFNAIQVAEEHIPKTAIIMPFGLYKYTRMPFGLRNAPKTFQRFINEIFGDLEFVFGYMDDLMIFSKMLEEHYKHVRIVIQRLKQFEMNVNLQ